MMTLRLPIALGLAAGLIAVYSTVPACSGDTGDASPTPTPPPSTGDGVVHMDGKDLPYSVVFEETKLLMLVPLTDDCLNPFVHAHVIESTSNVFTFTLNVDDPESSTLQAVVNVAGLEADLQENLALYPETAGNSFDEEERAEIEATMNEQIDAANYDTMTFSASDLTTMNGTGTASVAVDIKGIVSEIEMDGTATLDGDGRITLVASGVLDGDPYNIYSGDFSSCVDSNMPLDLTLVLEPTSAGTAQRR